MVPSDVGDGPLRVLHVIESYGSGSLTAAAQYVRSTPDLEHHVLRRKRDDYVPFEEESLFTSVGDLPASNVRCFKAVRDAVRELEPDVVHAHSSLGGLFVRLAFRRRSSTRIVYTPHCFAFERTTSPRPVRWALRLAEWMLAANTTVIAGCSEGEAATARAWATCRTAVHVPNFVPPGDLLAASVPGPVPVIATIGRLSPQKAPDFLVATIELLRKDGTDVRALWIGGGSPADVARIEESGVEVTGWITRDEVFKVLTDVDLYVHTAAWEGFPMSVLEAHSADLPIVVREIAPFRRLPQALRARTPAGVAALAAAVLDPAGNDAAANRRLWHESLRDHSGEVQRARLREAYGVA